MRLDAQSSRVQQAHLTVQISTFQMSVSFTVTFKSQNGSAVLPQFMKDLGTQIDETVDRTGNRACVWPSLVVEFDNPTRERVEEMRKMIDSMLSSTSVRASVDTVGLPKQRAVTPKRRLKMLVIGCIAAIASTEKQLEPLSSSSYLRRMVEVDIAENKSAVQGELKLNAELRKELDDLLSEDYENLANLVGNAATEWGREDWARCDLHVADVRKRLGEEIQDSSE